MHTANGHFYQVPTGVVYPSVTGKLGYVKDESIQNFAMNEALRYIEEHMHEVIVNGKIDMMKAIDLFVEAKKTPSGMLHAAADIGTRIHDRREEFFQRWIDQGAPAPLRPDIHDFCRIDDDKRIHAGMLGLDKFVREYKYIPIRTEVMVYSDKHQVAGMLDDIGIMWHKPKGARKGKWMLTLMDLKTSNQMKAHYWLQVAMYHLMFEDLTGLKPQLDVILKLNKDLPEFKLEYLKNIRVLKAGVKSVLKTASVMEHIKSARKNQGKTVITI